MDRVIRKLELLQIVGVSSATLHRWVAAGSFPPPIRLGANSVGWLASEVQEWLSSRHRAVTAMGPEED